MVRRRPQKTRKLRAKKGGVYNPRGYRKPVKLEVRQRWYRHLPECMITQDHKDCDCQKSMRNARDKLRCMCPSCGVNFRPINYQKMNCPKCGMLGEPIATPVMPRR